MSLHAKPRLSFDDWLAGERAVLESRSVDCTLKLAEVYDKVEIQSA